MTGFRKLLDWQTHAGVGRVALPIEGMGTPHLEFQLAVPEFYLISQTGNRK